MLGLNHAHSASSMLGKLFNNCLCPFPHGFLKLHEFTLPIDQRKLRSSRILKGIPPSLRWFISVNLTQTRVISKEGILTEVFLISLINFKVSDWTHNIQLNNALNPRHSVVHTKSGPNSGIRSSALLCIPIPSGSWNTDIHSHVHFKSNVPTCEPCKPDPLFLYSAHKSLS